MSSPENTPDDARPDDNTDAQVPPVAPAYSTPPPEGLPSADDNDG